MAALQRDSAVLRIGMAGLGMIFEETYLPVFDKLAKSQLNDPAIAPQAICLAATLTRTGARAAKYKSHPAFERTKHFTAADDAQSFLDSVDVVCVAPSVSSLWEGFLGHGSYAVVMSYVRPPFQAPISDADGAGAGVAAGADAGVVGDGPHTAGDIEVRLAQEFQEANRGLVAGVTGPGGGCQPGDTRHRWRVSTDLLRCEKPSAAEAFYS